MSEKPSAESWYHISWRIWIACDSHTRAWWELANPHLSEQGPLVRKEGRIVRFYYVVCGGVHGYPGTSLTNEKKFTVSTVLTVLTMSTGFTVSTNNNEIRESDSSGMFGKHLSISEAGKEKQITLISAAVQLRLSQSTAFFTDFADNSVISNYADITDNAARRQ